MGDFRFHFKATFSMGGYEDECDMSLNLDKGDQEYIDQRVINWLNQCFREGYENVHEGIHDAVERRRVQDERAQTEREREEYERLKLKFETDD